MEIGIVGLGRMGGNMVRRLARGGIRVTGWALEADVTRSLGEEAGFTPPESLAAMVAQLDAPRIVWVMVPAGAPTESTITGLKDLLEPGDVVVDGGNSMFKDSKRRSRELDEAGIGFVDAGVSGGVWGLSEVSLRACRWVPICPGCEIPPSSTPWFSTRPSRSSARSLPLRWSRRSSSGGCCSPASRAPGGCPSRPLP